MSLSNALNQELQDFINRFNDNKNAEMYDKLFERFEVDAPSSALNIVRHQIRNCLIFGIYEAAITLTNHYLERFLKVALVTSQSAALITDPHFNDEYKSLIGKYGSKNMNENLESAKSLSIITENEHSILVSFKNNFRNTYSHFDNKKITPKKDVRMIQFGISESSVEPQDLYISSGSIGLLIGNFSFDFAQRNALSYFIAIDDIAMRFELSQNPEEAIELKNDGFDIDKIFNEYKFSTTKPK